MEFKDLVLARCAQVGGGASFDFAPDLIDQEGRFAAAEIAAELPVDHLLLPSSTGLIAVADLAVLPLLRVAADDTTRERSVRGKEVFLLPADFSRLVQLELSGGITIHTLTARSVAFEVGRQTRRLVAPSPSTPEAVLVALAWSAAELASVDASDRVTGPLASLALTRVEEPPSADVGVVRSLAGAGVVSKLVYLRDKPAIDKLSGPLLDACAWFTASRLLQADPETAGTSGLAQQRGVQALRSLPVVQASVSIRRGRSS